MQNNETADVAIIGAGILGCMVARELTRYRCDVLVLEAFSDVGEGATKANSGIIHTGFHARGGSLKGVSCVKGNGLYKTIVEELDVPFKRTGGLYVSFHAEGLEKLKEKQERAAQSGAGRLEIVSGREALVWEPRLSPKTQAAMVAPSTGVISPFDLVQSCARNIVSNGVEIRFDAEVESIEKCQGMWRLIATDGRQFLTRFVVNAAGGMAAVLDAKVHPADIIVRPRRGQYLVFDKQDASADGKQPVKHVLFQAQESDEGGTLLAPTVDGNILVGPTSENIRAFHMNETTAVGLAHVERVAQKLIPDIELGNIITNFAGVRANISNIEKEQKDFVVRASASGFVSMLGIKNPGMTSSPYLAKLVVEILEKEGLALEDNPRFDPRAQKGHMRPFVRRSSEDQRAMIAHGRSYGHVVCRCEHITEGDVRACLQEAVPPRTLDGVKRRLRVGMGRCQGGFCTPRIIEIMARELGCKPEDILKSEQGGRTVKRAVK